MEVKKSSKANLENKKGIFFEIGLIVALACIFLCFRVESRREDGRRLHSNKHGRTIG